MPGGVFCGIVYCKVKSDPVPGVTPCVLPGKAAYTVILSGVFAVAPANAPCKRLLAVPETNVIGLVGCSSIFTENPQKGWSLSTMKSTVIVSPGLAFCDCDTMENVMPVFGTMIYPVG